MRKSDHRPLFFRLGAFCHRRRWLVLAVWIVGLAGSMPFVGQLTERRSNGGFEVPGSQSERVRIAVQNDFEGLAQFSDILILDSKDITAQDPRFQQTFQKVKAAI